MSPPLRNPYIVGGWVAGVNFYGHTALRQNLLEGRSNYLWVVGTRRVGKTSLLRQLAADAAGEFLPIYWDMQACENADDMGDELLYALEDRRQEFESKGLDIERLHGQDIRDIIGQICRAAAAHERRILLLIDEPEALIEVARQNAVAVRRLRAALERPGNLRVIMASTKSLVQLDELGRSWPTSPFLHGFAPRHLAGLSPLEAEGLIRQTQSLAEVEATDEVVKCIQEHTNNHPYLVQWLCFRLFKADGSLRMPGNADITLDSMLTALFALAFEHLSPTERRTLLHVLDMDQTNSATLAEVLGIDERDAYMYLYALTRLGYTRQVEPDMRVVIANSFLKRWLETRPRELAIEDAEVSDAAVREVAQVGHQEETGYWRQQLQSYRVNLARLEAMGSNFGAMPPLYLQNEIDAHQKRIRELEQRLDALKT